MKKALKKLKEEESSYLEKKDFESALVVCNEIINGYPKNKYGYLEYIKIKTDNYKKYISNDDVKELKNIYEKACKVLKDDERKLFENEFNNYLEDLKEVENLKKVKKDIISSYVLKSLYDNMISSINSNIETSKKYNLSGKRITNIYDFLKGLFYVSCLIYNIIYINKLLFITVPFGLFGTILIYSFINMNFIGKDKLLSEKLIIKVNIKKVQEKIKDLRNNIFKKENTITSLLKNKNDNILKIPTDFSDSISNIMDNNEEKIADEIIDSLYNNNVALFTYLINENTNLKVEDLLNMIKKEKEDNILLESLIDKKEKIKKENQSEIILMQKLKPVTYYISFLLLIISIFSMIIIIKNPSMFDTKSFIIAIVIGVVTTLIYNITSGKHKSFKDTFNDNLLATIFNSSLVYDLTYYAEHGKLDFIYGFIEIPIILTLLLIGFVSIISISKYRHLIIRLRK